MSIITELLTEKLRPKKFNQIVLLDRVKKNFPDGKLCQNVLFFGVQGTGKTSLAKILSSEYQTLYINVSNDRGIDIVRNQIYDFASTKSLEPGKNPDIKVVILDELDGATEGLFKALRATMEKFANTTRFIATCNYINKIPNPIKSRFSVIQFNPINKEEDEELKQKYFNRLSTISKKIGITWESDELLNNLIDKYIPDLRKIYSLLQDLLNSGNTTITSESIEKEKFKSEDFYLKIIDTSVTSRETYQMVISEFSGKSDDVFVDLATDFPNWIFNKKKELENCIPQIMICIAEWDFKRKQLIDENLGLIACIFQMKQIFSKK